MWTNRLFPSVNATGDFWPFTLSNPTLSHRAESIFPKRISHQNMYYSILCSSPLFRGKISKPLCKSAQACFALVPTSTTYLSIRALNDGPLQWLTLCAYPTYIPSTWPYFLLFLSPEISSFNVQQSFYFFLVSSHINSFHTALSLLCHQKYLPLVWHPYYQGNSFNQPTFTN